MIFPNCEIEIWNYGEDKTITDEYDESPTEYRYDKTVLCDMQNMSITEQEKEFGKVFDDRYKAYFTPDTIIDYRSILRVKNTLETYEIIGKPLLYNHGFADVAHLKVLLQLHEQPIELKWQKPQRRIPRDVEN